MLRFVTFVDGSNLDGVLKHLNLRVDDYGAFYRHVFEQSVHYWGRTFAEGSPLAHRPALADLLVRRRQDGRVGPERPQGRGPAAEPVRDEPAAPRQPTSRTSAGGMPDLPADRRIEEAWNLCFTETREWYESKRRALERKKRFYHGVQAATDFVEIRQEGHWKVDLLHHTVNEKGLDTSLAVDMVALQDTYDIALLISGDADGIPGHQLRQGPVQARRRRRVPPRVAGRLPHQGHVVAAQDRRRFRGAGVRGRPDPRATSPTAPSLTFRSGYNPGDGGF